LVLFENSYHGFNPVLHSLIFFLVVVFTTNYMKGQKGKEMYKEKKKQRFFNIWFEFITVVLSFTSVRVLEITHVATEA